MSEGALPDPLDEVERRIRRHADVLARRDEHDDRLPGLLLALHVIEETRAWYAAVDAEHVPGRVY